MPAIRDDSHGVAPESAPAQWMGVLIVDERAESIGARFQTKSQPGQGMQISVTWTDPGGT